MTSSREYTVDEIVELLKRTSLPTIVVEGREDIIVYRRIEERLSRIGVDVLPALGRKKLLQVFDRRNELPEAVNVVFIADRDTYLHSGIPPEYDHHALVFTDGYSIENDIYRDGQLENLLLGAERQAFENELDKFVSWYAVALSRHLADDTEGIKNHPNQVLSHELYDTLAALRDGEDFPQLLHDQLRENYSRMIRGKSLIGLLVRQTTCAGRQPQHNVASLLEIVAVKPGDLILRIQEEVASALLQS
jgi:hypothetical protein